MKTTLALPLILMAACRASTSTSREERPQREPAVHVRVSIDADPARPVQVELSGPFGEARGRTLRMAPSVVGTYERFPFGDFVHALSAFDHRGRALAVERGEDGIWTLASRGELRRVSYEVDVAAAEKAIDTLSQVARRRPGYMMLVGYSLFLLVDGAEEWPHIAEIACPRDWKIAWSLHPEAEGRYRAASAFELLDEPAMLGRDVQTLAVRSLEPHRFVHMWAESGSAGDHGIDRVAEAVSASARGIAALGFPPLEHPYHVFFELFTPRPGLRLGWALEHSQSFHGVDVIGRFQTLTPRIVYHVIHHELHAYVPRRLYTDRLHPRRQLLAEPTEFIFFAEGFAQYLAFCALAKSGSADTETTLRLLAHRFVTAYMEESPPGSPSMTAHSLYLCTDDQEHWRWEFAAGGLLALWLDEKLRARGDEAPGFTEVMLRLYERWRDHDTGLPEEQFEEIFSEVSGFDVRDIFARYVRGRDRLPVEEILAAAGVVREPQGFKVLTGGEVPQSVSRFRSAAFR